MSVMIFSCTCVCPVENTHTHTRTRETQVKFVNVKRSVRSGPAARGLRLCVLRFRARQSPFTTVTTTHTWSVARTAAAVYTLSRV